MTGDDFTGDDLGIVDEMGLLVDCPHYTLLNITKPFGFIMLTLPSFKMALETSP